MGQKLKSTKICMINSLPDDIALKIASSLQLADVCRLSSSSRYWRQVCGSDCVWKALFMERWPEIGSNHKDSSAKESHSHQDTQHLDPSVKGWRKIYRYKHEEMAKKSAFIIHNVEGNSRSDSIEIDYLNEAVAYLKSEKFGTIDIDLFLRPEVSVLVNLIALFYCRLFDILPEESLLEALNNAEISERQVWIKWGMNNQGGIPREKLVSLNTLAGTYSGRKVLDVVRRGVIGELQVRISAVNLSPHSGLARLQTWGNF